LSWRVILKNKIQSPKAHLETSLGKKKENLEKIKLAFLLISEENNMISLNKKIREDIKWYSQFYQFLQVVSQKKKKKINKMSFIKIQPPSFAEFSSQESHKTLV